MVPVIVRLAHVSIGHVLPHFWKEETFVSLFHIMKIIRKLDFVFHESRHLFSCETAYLQRRPGKMVVKVISLV
ncbi:UNVERIFIED_CONTAM: hypothetical protein NCL1_53816 [Trichonephila clavipes]